MRRSLALFLFVVPLACAAQTTIAPPQPGVGMVEPAPPARQVAADVPVVALPAPSADEEATPSEPEIAIPPSTAGGGWPLFHGDAARTGRSDAPAIASPVVLWRARVGIQGWLNSPVVAGALVLVPSSGIKHNSADGRDGVHALSLATGKAAWFAPFKGDANGAAVAEGKAFATSDDGHVYALDLASGKEAWAQKGDGKMYTTPLVAGDRVVVGDERGYVRAFALSDGAPLWKVQLRGAIRGGASADGTQIYVGSQDGEVAALRLDGSVVWRTTVTYPGFGSGKPTPAQIYAAPVITGTSVIVPFARDTYYESPALVALSKKTGKVQWRGQQQPPQPPQGNVTWGNIRATPALTQQSWLVYAEPYSGDVVGIDSRDGSVLFRRTVGPCFFPHYAAPAIAGDVVYVPRFDGALYAMRTDGGGPLWQLYLGEERRVGPTLPGAIQGQGGCEWAVPSGSSLYAPPAIAEDGTLIVGSGEGVVFAIADSSRARR